MTPPPPPSRSTGTPRRDWLLVGIGFAGIALVAASWLAVDRRPPEWDHANHLERALLCARDLAAADTQRVLQRSSFYPPLVPCAAGLVARVFPSDVAAAQAVILAFLALGMCATYMLGRRVADGTVGVVAALLFGSAPFVVFSTLKFQLDLPLAAMVAVTLLAVRESDGLRHRSWSLAVGGLLGLGLLTKPPFGLYVAPAVLWLATQARYRRRLANGLGLCIVAIALAFPWYGPRLFGLQTQAVTRAEAIGLIHDADPLSWVALTRYLAWFPTQFGVLAAALAAFGLAVAIVRRRWDLVASLAGPLLLVTLLPNKNLRYTLPLLPLAAVIAGLGFTAVPRRWRAGVAAALAAMALVQVGATAYGAAGARVPLLGVPLGIASPPQRVEWPHRRILDLIDRHRAGTPATVSVVPNHELFSAANFRYYALRDERGVVVTRSWDEVPLGIDYMVLKTGDVGPAWTEPKIRRATARVTDPAALARVYPVIGEFSLPDGSLASVRVRHIREDVDASPAAVAGAVETALRARMTDLARDVDGLEIRLSYDRAILRGRLDRIDMRASAATIAEFKRPGAARLRVTDLRLVAEDVLVEPFGAYLGGRLDPLDVKVLRLERATVSAASLQSFLAGLPKFRPGLALEAGTVAVAVRQPGPDITGRVRIATAGGPLVFRAEQVRVGGVAVPQTVVDWIVRSFDPVSRLLQRLPMTVAIGPVRVAPDAIRFGD